MGKKSKKMERNVPRMELEKLDSELNAFIASMLPELCHEIDLEGWEKIKISAKRYGNTNATLSLKLKYSDVEILHITAPKKDTTGYDDVALDNVNKGMDMAHFEKKGDYKALKKEMKGTFNKLKEAAKEHQLPAGDIFEKFLLQSNEMVQFPNKGEEFYHDYKKGCAELQSAYVDRDEARYVLAIEKLDMIKKQAHARYK